MFIEPVKKHFNSSALRYHQMKEKKANVMMLPVYLSCFRFACSFRRIRHYGILVCIVYKLEICRVFLDSTF